jgi:hypothetical protein
VEASVSCKVPAVGWRSKFSPLGLDKFQVPCAEARSEARSCHVFEDSIQVDGRLSEQERTRLLNSILVGSADEATARGCSLALIRPSNTRFIVHHKRPGQIEAERDAYKRAANQTSMFDKELADLEPTPVKFYFRFDDASGSHRYENGDWETHAMFRRERTRSGEAEALRWMEGTFNEEYPRKGMVFAIGNQAKRPQVWQLLGVLRLDAPTQGEFSL